MRILHVIPGLNNASGPTQVVFHLSREAVRAGHQVSVYYISGRGTEPELDFDSGVELRGFQAIGLKHWGFSPALWRHLGKSMHQFDMVHIHSIWLFPNIAAAFHAKRQGKPYIIRPAGSLEPWALQVSGIKKKAYFKLIEKPIIQKAAAIQAASGKEAETISLFGFKPPILLIPNGIDLSSFDVPMDRAAVRKKHNIPADAFVMLYLGRLAPVKNLPFLAEAVNQVWEKHPKIFWIIAGPDQSPYARELKERIAQFSFPCQFTGAVIGNTKLEWMKAADVFVLPSQSENFAVAVAEAMAAGLPVLVSQETPWESVNQRQAGFWLPLDASQFAEKLLQLAQNPQMCKQLASNALDLAQEFDWTKIQNQLTAAYNRIIEKK